MILLSQECVIPFFFISARTLRRFCQVNTIKRYDEKLLPRDVLDAVSEEAADSAQRLGYRRMWERLRRKNIRVKRDQVAACMKLLGLEKEMPYNKRHKKQHHIYTSQGPNYLWHIDGFDKLNRWGFYVHGAIDGYSRKMLWLQVFVTNKDPWLVGKFFMEYVKESSVCPCRTRTDPGTENPILAIKCQMFLRRHHDDALQGPNSHYTGSSEINQPIEAFWHIFREGGSQFWIDHFKPC
ncbi:uncharacterized protein [Acropora muricata]|uniref:uncharacterized protein n=1 Tax=Acropora muricata TaxID=159855 RepID=UPI0034E5BC77